MDIAVLRKGGSIEMCPNMIEIDDIKKVGNKNLISKKWSINLKVIISNDELPLLKINEFAFDGNY